MGHPSSAEGEPDMKERTVPGGMLLLALGTVLLLAGCTTRIITSGGTTPLNTVTASGTGETVAAPDLAEMYFGVTVRADSATKALNDASATAERIASAVKGEGIADEDIQTANVSVYPLQFRQGDEVVITGYQASVQVRVKIRDIEKIGSVITAANTAGANEISGPSFMLSDDSVVRNEAITLAIADARNRAEVMADAVGKDLGTVISVSESGLVVPIYTQALSHDTAESAKVAIEPGQLDITANVTVVFELK
jgi:uncharacterized protein